MNNHFFIYAPYNSHKNLIIHFSYTNDISESNKANMPTTAEKMLAAIRSKLTQATYLLETKEEDCRHCEVILKDLMTLLEIKPDEEPSEPAYEEGEEPESPVQKVSGCYAGDAEWFVPRGIDLEDYDTYEYWTRWGTLYIKNKITGDTIHVEMDEAVVFDTKHCDGEILNKGADY